MFHPRLSLKMKKTPDSLAHCTLGGGVLFARMTLQSRNLMAFTITFHSLEEKLPAHNQEIAFFDTHVNGYGFQMMDLKFGKVFYVWGNDDGSSWIYEGEEEFIYDDGTKPDPEENMQLKFCINEEGENLSVEYGPVSNIKKYFAKTIYWTDYSQMSETIPVDGSVEDWDKELNYA